MKKALPISLVIILSVLLLVFMLKANSSSGKSNDDNYYGSPNYYQDIYESCHSTYEHKQAIYSYDLNNDNYLSEYELELFFKAHPRVTNDKPFVAWVEDHLG